MSFPRKNFTKSCGCALKFFFQFLARGVPAGAGLWMPARRIPSPSIALLGLPPAAALCVGSGCDVLRVGLLGFVLGGVAVCCLCGHGVAIWQARRHGGGDGLTRIMVALAALGLVMELFAVGYTAGVLGENNRWDLWPLLLFATLFLLAFAALLVWWVQRARRRGGKVGSGAATAL